MLGAGHTAHIRGSRAAAIIRSSAWPLKHLFLLMKSKVIPIGDIGFSGLDLLRRLVNLDNAPYKLFIHERHRTRSGRYGLGRRGSGAETQASATLSGGPHQ